MKASLSVVVFVIVSVIVVIASAIVDFVVLSVMFVIGSALVVCVLFVVVEASVV